MKLKIFLIAFAIILSGGVAYYLSTSSFYSSKSTSKINTSTNSSSQSISSKTIKEYSDPAGFSFSYPGSVSISPQDTSDEDTYSSLQATSSSSLGKITIEAVATNLLSLDTLLKSKTGVTEVKLADLTAKQYAEKGSLVTLALDKGVLFTLTVSSGGNVQFWNEVNDKIISSFAFAPPESAQIVPESGESDITFEGEEVIE